MAKISEKFDAGDIVNVNLDPTVGNEQKKIRPCLIMECTASPLQLAIVLPITSIKPGAKIPRFCVEIKDWAESGLRMASAIDCYQIRTVDTMRFLARLGSVGSHVMDEVKKRVAYILDIGEEHVT